MRRRRQRQKARSIHNCILQATIAITSVIVTQGMQAHGAEMNKEVTELITKYPKDHPTNKLEIRNDPLSNWFDTGSYVLVFDCQASACILNIESHFEDIRDWKEPMLKGFGATTIAKIWTWVCDIQDDSGRTHTIKVPGSLFVPNIQKCLAYPQHIAQTHEQTITEKTVLLTGAQGVTFTFELKGEHTISIKHNPRSNVPEVNVALNCRSYHSFVAVVNVQT